VSAGKEEASWELHSALMAEQMMKQLAESRWWAGWGRDAEGGWTRQGQLLLLGLGGEGGRCAAAMVVRG